MASRYYQRYNKKIDRWVKIDSYTGLIVTTKKTSGPYKNLPRKKPAKKPPKQKKPKDFWDKFFG